MGPAVFGYIRISQVEGESGLATQRRIFTDVASGKSMRRPSWKSLHEMLKPRDTVVVPRIDRLARNLTEGLKTTEELHDQGINIRSLAEGLDTGDDSPTSRLMLHMLLSLAEWERGHHPGPDQGRRGPRRGGGENRGQASGAVIGEGGGRQEFPGERRVGQIVRQDLRGEPPHRALRQARDLREPTPHDLRPHQALGYRTAAKMFAGRNAPETRSLKEGRISLGQHQHHLQEYMGSHLVQHLSCPNNRVHPRLDVLDTLPEVAEVGVVQFPHQ